MKRAAIGFAGIAYGMFLTWLCLYIFSRVTWPTPHVAARGCADLEHCSAQWWTYPLLFATLFAPAILFGLLNTVAWQRWTVRKWAWVAGLLTVATSTLYLAAYALP